MKALVIEGNAAKYRIAEDEALHPIKDISENDVLAIVSLILDGKVPEMDDVPENDSRMNSAEFVIYRELHKQFSSLISKREIKLKAIDDQFREAEELYKSEGLRNEFIELGTEEPE